MTDYPSGIYALAEPEKLAIRRWNQSDDWVNSYMTNGTLYCIPERVNNGWQCVNPRRDYQNVVERAREVQHYLIKPIQVDNVMETFTAIRSFKIILGNAAT